MRKNKSRGTRESRLYKTWCNMKSRCTNKNVALYKKYYGDKGISFCAEWNEFFEFEKWAIASGYKDGLSIDRIDGSKGYCPDNCRWATKLQQVVNRRNSRTRKYRGVRKLGPSWQARITVTSNGKQESRHLGTFPSGLQAALAYDSESYARHGEFAVLNFPERYRKAVSQ